MLAFLTDFGVTDTYDVQMELVARDMLPPQVPITHLTHGVPPFQVAGGAWLLGTVATYLPAEAVVVAVVDPGVGTDRPLVWARLTGGAQAVATDPDLLAFCPLEGGVRQIPPSFIPQAASQTFHGRDVLTPLACRLLAQQTPKPNAPNAERIDPTLWHKLRWKKPAFSQVGKRLGTLTCQVVHVDHFGNLITPLSRETVGHKAIRSLSVNERPIYNQTETFAQGGNQPFWYWGSQGTLEIALFKSSASRHLDAKSGALVRAVLGGADEGGAGRP